MRATRAKVMTQMSTESFLRDLKPERAARKNYTQLHNGNFDILGPSSPGTPTQSKETGKKRKSPGSLDSQMAGTPAKKPHRSLKVKPSTKAAAQDDQTCILAEMLMEFYEASSVSSSNSPRDSAKGCNGPAGAVGLDDEDMACAEALMDCSCEKAPSEGAAAWRAELPSWKQLQDLATIRQGIMKISNGKKKQR